MDILVEHGDDNDSWSLFPILTDNLSSSYIDKEKLINFGNDENAKPIGMSNFRSKSSNSEKRYNNNRYIKNITNSVNNNSGCNKNENSHKVITRWKLAVLKAKLINDPWVEFHIEKFQAERVIRHRYNAIKKKWIQDECIVKMEDKQFANGAMRACFRLKKLSHYSHRCDWEHATNYVAKAYMDSTTPKERYLDDVKLQMDAKLWAENYNRHNPAKKVDIFQVSIAEFIDRPNSPFYHLEHYIEGKYIKYNSNSGYVDECLRCTPQAFSHFTFESSNHELIVVDIQGVGDLYTDPQIHTAKGTEYGDGNLGTKGMALFFHSHVCNNICKSLGLTPFDLAPNELKQNEKLLTSMQNCSSLTISKGHEELCIGSPTSFGEYFRVRTKSRNSSSDAEYSMSCNDIDESEGYESSSSSSVPLSPTHSTQMISKSIPIPHHNGHNGHSRRIRTQSSCLDSAFSPDDAASYFRFKDGCNPRPSCVLVERATIDEDDNAESILGRIHLDLCKYHEMGRFVINENEEFDKDTAFFHLQQSANLGVLDALLNISKIYYNIPHDILSSYLLQECEDNVKTGFDYMYQAAEKGDKSSMLFIAKSFDTGVNLRKDYKKNWKISIEWYQKVVNSVDDESLLEDAGYSDANDDPTYVILARMAEMYSIGGNGIDKSTGDAYELYNEAAEKATLYGKGRMANKYYMLAESCSTD